MKYILYLVAIFLLFIINFGILVPFGLGWLTPSLFLLVVVAMSVEYDSLDFFFFALLSGLWLDVYFGLPIGSFAGGYVLIGFIGHVLFNQFFLTESRTKYYLIFVVATDLILLGWLWFYTMVLERMHWTTFAVSGVQLVHHAFVILIVSILAAFPIYGLLGFINRLVNQWWHKPLRLS